MPSFNGTIDSKLPLVGTTIFTVMSAMADQHNAINLSQGFPDFPVDPALVELVAHHMRAGRNQYPPMAGVLKLREIIAAKIQDDYGAIYDPDREICITAGATQAIFTAITALVGEGDEVIIFTPAYDCYAPAVELAGAKPVYIPLKATDYSVDWKQVKKLVTRHTRMIVINSPHNPTGAVWSEKDVQELTKLCRGTDIIVLSDEVYEHVIFDGEKHRSMAANPELAERAVIVFSFGKTFHVTGWKTGYVLAPAELMAEFKKVHQFNVFTANAPIQYAMADYMSNPETYRHVAAMYQHLRDTFVHALSGSRFKIRPSRGTYFQLLDYSEISDVDDTDMANALVRDFGIASIPVSVFYHNPQQNKVLRFCFAKEEQTLLRAAEILHRV